MVTCPCKMVSMKGNPKIIDPGKERAFGIIKISHNKKKGQAKINSIGTDKAQFIKAIRR